MIGLFNEKLNLILTLKSFTGYLTLALVFVWNSALRRSFISVFQGFFSSISKVFILAGGMVAGLSFYGVLRFLWYFLISRDRKSYVVRQLIHRFVYTMFITNNHSSFYWWWKENLVKHQSLKIRKWLKVWATFTNSMVATVVVLLLIPLSEIQQLITSSTKRFDN